MAHHEKEYSINMHRIIHSCETDKSWLLNLLKLLLLKGWICENGYLTFYNNMEQSGKLGYR